jgi:hypothetical protein
MREIRTSSSMSGSETERCRMAQATVPILDSIRADERGCLHSRRTSICCRTRCFSAVFSAVAQFARGQGFEPRGMGEEILRSKGARRTIRASCSCESLRVTCSRPGAKTAYISPAFANANWVDLVVVVVSRARSIVGRWTIVSRAIVSPRRNVVSRGLSVEPRAWCAAKAVA